jgi:hypothetical protein
MAKCSCSLFITATTGAIVSSVGLPMQLFRICQKKGEGISLT